MNYSNDHVVLIILKLLILLNTIRFHYQIGILNVNIFQIIKHHEHEV